MTLEVAAPAKLNLCLEVTGRREDGYHEIVSVAHTIDLCDRVLLGEASELELRVTGETARGVPPEGPENLAYAAAVALREAAGQPGLGARIELEKRIPAGMGLGGGSADAAAVLRGLNRLWSLGYPDERLAEIGAGLGSDVPLCVIGGACLVTGRGERVERLPDAQALSLTLFLPDAEVARKTERMYGMLTPADYTDGSMARRLAERIRAGQPVTAEAMHNVFDPHLAAVSESAGRAMEACREAGIAVFACGSGPGFFAPAPAESLPRGLLDRVAREVGVRAVSCRTLGREEATAVREV